MRNSLFLRVVSPFVLTVFISMVKPSPVAAQTTGTSVLSVTVAAAGTLTVLTATTSLTGAGFAPYTGTTNLQFSVRATPATGSGSLTVSFASNWAPAGGPSIIAAPIQLSYICGAIGGGSPLTGATPCAGTQNVGALATPFTVVTFAAGSQVGNGTETQTWTLTNSAAYAVGTYTTTATYTLSVT